MEEKQYNLLDIFVTQNLVSSIFNLKRGPKSAILQFIYRVMISWHYLYYIAKSYIQCLQNAGNQNDWSWHFSISKPVDIRKLKLNLQDSKILVVLLNKAKKAKKVFKDYVSLSSLLLFLTIQNYILIQTQRSMLKVEPIIYSLFRHWQEYFFSSW